ncbi:unnamed protein product [Prorocentrum cordatum]|uniref:Uncharacterized protein n=1 Tax=Prorocentrum cordatum TaxID=2364126 RepID=A0ABN9U221_9DINO|nr:unnamed protein product [Polarella glacialis]
MTTPFARPERSGRDCWRASARPTASARTLAPRRGLWGASRRCASWASPAACPSWCPPRAASTWRRPRSPRGCAPRGPASRCPRCCRGRAGRRGSAGPRCPRRPARPCRPCRRGTARGVGAGRAARPIAGRTAATREGDGTEAALRDGLCESAETDGVWSRAQSAQHFTSGVGGLMLPRCRLLEERTAEHRDSEESARREAQAALGACLQAERALQSAEEELSRRERAAVLRWMEQESRRGPCMLGRCAGRRWPAETQALHARLRGLADESRRQEACGQG